MKIVGALRVRNEKLLIRDSIGHQLSFADEVIMLDDASTDDTIGQAVSVGDDRLTVLTNATWSSDRLRAETTDRHRLLAEARQRSADWFVYMDADERFECDIRAYLESLSPSIQAVRFRLFDAYLTKDVHQAYKDGDLRATPRMFGPEYRSILMAWRPNAALEYLGRDQREPVPGLGVTQLEAPYRVQHYGKAISVAEWETTCSYYANHFPEPYRSKWLARRGQPFHTASIEGRPLGSWPVPPESQVPLASGRNGVKYLLRRAQVSLTHRRVR